MFIQARKITGLFINCDGTNGLYQATVDHYAFSDAVEVPRLDDVFLKSIGVSTFIVKVDSTRTFRLFVSLFRPRRYSEDTSRALLLLKCGAAHDVFESLRDEDDMATFQALLL